MLLSNEFSGKKVSIEMIEFANSVSKKYNGMVEKIISYGDNLIMIKLDTGVTLNTKYIMSITVID